MQSSIITGGVSLMLKIIISLIVATGIYYLCARFGVAGLYTGLLMAGGFALTFSKL